MLAGESMALKDSMTSASSNAGSNCCTLLARKSTL